MIDKQKQTQKKYLEWVRIVFDQDYSEENIRGQDIVGL